MIRGNKALLFSFTIHTFIALFAVLLYKQWPAEQGGETRFKIALSCLLEQAEPAPACLCEVGQDMAEEQEAPQPKRVEAKKPAAKPAVAEKPKILEVAKKTVVTTEADMAEQKESVAAEPAAEEPEAGAAAEPEPAEEGIAEETAEASAASTPAAAPSGAEGNTEALPAAVSAEEHYLQEHIRQIARLLRENLYYPRIARKRGITGDVTVSFELLRNGEVQNINVTSGKRGILNRAAVTTIERLSGEFPRPDEPITLHVPINYRLQ